MLRVLYSPLEFMQDFHISPANSYNPCEEGVFLIHSLQTEKLGSGPLKATCVRFA